MSETLPSVWQRAQPGVRADTLMVLLPGAYDTPQDFIDQGFVHAVRQRALALDVLLVDAHMHYYTAQTIVERLLQDVIAPARAAGYLRVWLGGISLGGYGSLLFAQAHGAWIDGLFVMAAFLGRRDVPAAVARAGGLRAWHGDLPDTDPHDLALWRWLRAYAQAEPSSTAATRPPLYMGWGENDRFVASNRLVGAVLPSTQVFITHGGHDWSPWHRLWARFLDAAPFLPPN